MNYYKSNAIYEYLLTKNLPQFKFVVGNAWQLVYGDNQCDPLVLIFAVGVKSEELFNSLSTEENEAYNLLKMVGEKANLPVKQIRFASDVEEIEKILILDVNDNLSEINMVELSELYKSFGLPVSNTRTEKYLNDATSSAYHNWQRTSLGKDLTVSDIDLWRVNNNGVPEIIFELKRSFYDLKRWKPFTDDYRNFQLISNLCNKSGIDFKILYNQRIKEPFEDKIDSLKLFSVDFSKQPPINEDGIISLVEFDNF